MVTYVVVVVVVVAVLYLSFRALGGGAPVAAEDYRTVLARIGEFATARADELDEAVGAAATRSRQAALTEADPLAAIAAAARKKLTGYQEQLARLEVDAEGDERDLLGSARSLLSAGIEDLGWACRMLEAGNHADNPGVQRAVAELQAAGRECLQAAAGLVGDPAPVVGSTP
jgi:acyl-CoA reductase-like NAD-dependent aldehyde dehydrogenase